MIKQLLSLCVALLYKITSNYTYPRTYYLFSIQITDRPGDTERRLSPRREKQGILSNLFFVVIFSTSWLRRCHFEQRKKMFPVVKRSDAWWSRAQEERQATEIVHSRDVWECMHGYLKIEWLFKTVTKEKKKESYWLAARSVVIFQLTTITQLHEIKADILVKCKLTVQLCITLCYLNIFIFKGGAETEILHNNCSHKRSTEFKGD